MKNFAKMAVVMKKRRIFLLIPLLLILLILFWRIRSFPLVEENKIDQNQQIIVTSTTFGFIEDSPELTPEEYSVFPQDPMYPKLRSLLTDTSCHFSFETIMGGNQNRDYNAVYRFSIAPQNVVRVFDDGVVYDGSTYYRIKSDEKEAFFSELEMILATV